MDNKKDPKEIPYLDGTRAIACLIVFISHAANEGLLPSRFGHGFGQLGVMIFFVLSGFLMGRLYLHKDPGQFMRPYISSRIARVLPLYYVILVSSLLISLFPSSQELFYYFFDLRNHGQVIGSLTLMTGYKVMWSIPVEVRFYLGFILLWILTMRARQKIRFSLLVAAAFTILSIALQRFFYISNYWFAFLFGVAAHHLSLAPIQSKAFRGAIHATGVIWLALIFISRPDLGSMHFKEIFRYTWHNFLYWVFVLCFFFSVIFKSKSLAFLDFAPLKYLGKLSYGFYLYHYCFLILVTKKLGAVLGPFPLLFLSLALTTLMSHLSFHYFEKPAARFILARLALPHRAETA